MTEGCIFYSNAEKGVLSIKQEKATPQQWLSMLINSGSLKKGEDEWIGLSEWLSRCKEKTLNKADVLTYIENHKIQLRELIIEATDSRRNDFTTQGLSNKKEIIFTVPNIESWNSDDDIHFGDITDGKAIAWARIGEYINNKEKVLVVDEIQSARHQAKKIRSGEYIPPAPFEKNWFEMTMKRLLRYAGEYHFDYISWTTGNQQAERYKLSLGLEIKNLIYIPGTTSFFPGQLILQPENHNPTFHAIGNIEDLAHITGHKLAEKIKDGELNMSAIKLEQNGLQEMYDTILPTFIKRYSKCKKWDTKIKMSNILGHNMYSLPVTDKMRTDVMQGQAMFKSKEKQKANKTLRLSDVDNVLSQMEDVLTANIKVINNRTELPSHLRLGMIQSKCYQGLYDIKDDTAYLLLSEITNKEEIEKVIKHEVLGHKGLRALKNDKLHLFLDRVFPLIPEFEKAEYLKKYWNDKYIATEEYICDQAESYQNPTRWENIKAIFRSCMRDWGFNIRFSNADLRHILSQGRKLLEKSTSLINISTKDITGQTCFIAQLSRAVSDRSFEKVIFPLGQKWNGQVNQQKKIVVFKDKENAIQFKKDCCLSLKRLLPPPLSKKNKI